MPEGNYDSAAFPCWQKLMPNMEMAGCLANPRFNSAGIVAGCEADVLFTVSMLILRYITKDVVALMNFSRFDGTDDSLMF